MKVNLSSFSPELIMLDLILGLIVQKLLILLLLAGQN